MLRQILAVSPDITDSQRKNEARQGGGLAGSTACSRLAADFSAMRSRPARLSRLKPYTSAGVRTNRDHQLVDQLVARPRCPSAASCKMQQGCLRCAGNTGRRCSAPPLALQPHHMRAAFGQTGLALQDIETEGSGTGRLSSTAATLPGSRPRRVARSRCRDANILAIDLILVVQGGIGHRHAADKHRPGAHRRQCTGSATCTRCEHGVSCSCPKFVRHCQRARV